jgi:hypothetical protein
VPSLVFLLAVPSVTFNVTSTFPAGVYLPVEVSSSPVNVGYEIVPDGVYSALCTWFSISVVFFVILWFMSATLSGWSSNQEAKSCSVLKLASALSESNYSANSSLAIVLADLSPSGPIKISSLLVSLLSDSARVCSSAIALSTSLANAAYNS